MAIASNEWMAGQGPGLVLLQRDPRKAIGEDEIACLVCGKAFRQLTNTHLVSHGFTSDEYRERFGYNRRRPLMCLALVKLYRDRAREVRLAERIRRRPIVADPKLRRQGGARTVFLEEYLTRSELQRQPRARWNRRDGQGRYTTQMVGRTQPCS